MTCTHFRPGPTNPEICKWWIMPPPTIETMWTPFCASTLRLNKECPSEGRNPQEQEEDSFE